MQLEKFFVLVLASILLGPGNVDAKIKRGDINSEKDHVFLDTFYFSNSENNVLDYTIKYPADQCCYRLVIFDESYGQWGGIRPKEDRLTCRNKIDRVKDLDYKIKLSGRDPACHMETDNAGLNWLICHDRINFASRQRPQSYFVHLTNCRSNRKGFRNVTYEIHMTNGNNGLMKEFAQNQKFMMETDLTFFLGYVVMTIFATRFRYVLSLKKLLHLTYRLFYSSLFLKTVCLLLLNIDLARFARTGLQLTRVQDIAEILSCLSSILFVSVLILVSKGFSITRAHVSLFGTVKMIVFGLLYAATYTVAFFDQRVLIDPRDIITSMTSLSASGVIAIKIVGCIVFVYGCFITIKNHPAKALFYVPFAVFFSSWFMAEPVYRMLAFYVYPVLRSPNIWNGIDLAFCFIGHAYFIFLTRPDRLNKRFPFHLPTAKISFRDVEEDSPHQPAVDFFSMFQTEKNPATGMDAFTITIHDEPEHFLTPVLPFNADISEYPRPCRPTSPVATTSTTVVSVVPTVSASVARSTDNLAATTPEVRPLTSLPPPPPPPTGVTGFAVMPYVKAKPIKHRIENLPTLASIPQSDRAAVGVSTVAVPRGGFGIFSAQQLKDIPTCPKVSDTKVPEHKEKVKDISTCPKVSDTEVPKHKKEKVKDIPTCPKVSGTELPEHKKEKDKNIPTCPKVSGTELPEHKKEKDKNIPTCPKVSDTEVPEHKKEKDKNIPTCPKVSGTELPEHKKEKDKNIPTCPKVSGTELPEHKKEKDKNIPTCPKVSDTELPEHKKEKDKNIPTCPKVSGTELPEHKKEKDKNIPTCPKVSDTEVPEHKKEKDKNIPTCPKVSGTELPEHKKEKDKNIPTCPKVSDTEVPEHKKEKDKDIPTCPKVSGTEVPEHKKEKDKNIPTCPKVSDTEAPEHKKEKDKDIPTCPKVSGTEVPEHKKEKVHYGDKVAAPKEGCSIFSSVQKQQDTWTSLKVSDTDVLEQKTEKDCIVNQVRGDGRSFLPAVIPSTNSPVLPPIKTIEGSGSAFELSNNPSLTRVSPNVRIINVKPVEEPLQITHQPGLAPVPIKTKDTVSAPKLPAWTTDWKSMEIDRCQVPAPKIQNWTTEPLGPVEIRHSKSSPGLITLQPIKVQEHELPKINSTSKEDTLKEGLQDQELHGSPPAPSTSLTIGQRSVEQEPELLKIISTSQEETPKESLLQDQGPHGPPAPPTSLTIGPRSLEQDCLPAADGGDFQKIGRKTQREPSSRRFAKPTKTGLNPETTPPEVKAMDPKTKKKRLRRFLKLARKHKTNKLSKAD